jgi:hypothetical protein
MAGRVYFGPVESSSSMRHPAIRVKVPASARRHGC